MRFGIVRVGLLRIRNQYNQHMVSGPFLSPESTALSPVVRFGRDVLRSSAANRQPTIACWYLGIPTIPTYLPSYLHSPWDNLFRQVFHSVLSEESSHHTFPQNFFY